MYHPDAQYQIARAHQNELLREAADERLARQIRGGNLATPKAGGRISRAQRAALAFVLALTVIPIGFGISQAAAHHARPVAPASQFQEDAGSSHHALAL
jgi:anti-sigma factor RsiW